MLALSGILANWKTSAPGAILIGLGLLEGLTGVQVPGFNMGAGAAIAAGAGLLMAKDLSTTATTTTKS